jgi:CPA2 family monovalent cation:H+ antiporter-2
VAGAGRRPLRAGIQPFAALYVLVCAVLGPLITKESERLYGLAAGFLARRGGAAVEEPEEF